MLLLDHLCINESIYLTDDLLPACRQMSLKCADLGHLAASKEVHCNWVNRLEEEVRMDQEQQLGRSTGSRESGTKCAVCRYAESLLKDMTPRWMPRPLQFFAQGDRELEAGLPISPLMDRTKEGITKSQPGVRKSTGYERLRNPLGADLSVCICSKWSAESPRA